MNLKHNYKGKRNDINQPSYINYCFGKCYYFLNKLKKRPVVGGSINKGFINRILKYISLFYDNDVKVVRFSKKRLFYRKKQNI
jgi:hypothetical protein